MKQFFKKYRLYILLISIGAIAGFSYWYFIGCTTGTCPLKALWYYDVGFGAFAGYVLTDFIVERRHKAIKKEVTRETTP